MCRMYTPHAIGCTWHCASNPTNGFYWSFKIPDDLQLLLLVLNYEISSAVGWWLVKYLKSIPAATGSNSRHYCHWIVIEFQAEQMTASLNIRQQLSILLNLNPYNVRPVCVGCMVDEVALEYFIVQVGTLAFLSVKQAFVQQCSRSTCNRPQLTQQYSIGTVSVANKPQNKPRVTLWLERSWLLRVFITFCTSFQYPVGINLFL
jgi:hypothetical protein